MPEDQQIAIAGVGADDRAGMALLLAPFELNAGLFGRRDKTGFGAVGGGGGAGDLILHIAGRQLREIFHGRYKRFRNWMQADQMGIMARRQFRAYANSFGAGLGVIHVNENIFECHFTLLPISVTGNPRMNGTIVPIAGAFIDDGQMPGL